MFWKKKNKDKMEQKKTDPAHEAKGSLPVRVVVKTDLGKVRTNNEDSASFFRFADEDMAREKGCLLIVADGMGGHQAGEVASRMAVEIISDEYFKQTNGANVEKNLARAFTMANKKIFELASANEKYRGMGTTCTTVAVIGQTIYYAHAGDSRAYLYKNKRIARITEDHTYVQELVKNGNITVQEAHTHPQRNILTNAMGTKPSMRIDTGKYETRFDQHDRLLVCSDGLYDYFDDNELAQILDYSSLQEAADRLIEEARRRGGKDNITVALAELAGVDKGTNLKLTRDVELPAGN